MLWIGLRISKLAIKGFHEPASEPSTDECCNSHPVPAA